MGITKVSSFLTTTTNNINNAKLKVDEVDLLVKLSVSLELNLFPSLMPTSGLRSVERMRVYDFPCTWDINPSRVSLSRSCHSYILLGRLRCLVYGHITLGKLRVRRANHLTTASPAVLL